MDDPRFAMIGNAVSVPVARHIGECLMVPACSPCISVCGGAALPPCFQTSLASSGRGAASVSARPSLLWAATRFLAPRGPGRLRAISRFAPQGANSCMLRDNDGGPGVLSAGVGTLAKLDSTILMANGLSANVLCDAVAAQLRKGKASPERAPV